MNLHIHIPTNLEFFRLLNEWFLLSTWKRDRDLASFFMTNFSWEIADNISPQYEINFMAIREIKSKIWQDAFNKIDGIYYWSDNCEYLAPYKAEVEQAINLFKEFNKNYPPHKVRTFTLVTPYVWEVMLEKLEESLAYLNDLNIKNPIEVVVNDLWVLRLLKTKYTNLKIIFWRLIHKILKTPLIDTYGYDVHPAWDLIANKNAKEIEELKEKIRFWQMKFYNSSESNLEIFRNFMKKNWVDRTTLDYMEKRENLFNNPTWSEIWIDLYYPWCLVFTWRLCDTSSIENPVRWYYATDEICPRTCNRYDVFYKVKTSNYKLIQRWNAWFRSELNLDYLSTDFRNNENNRLVFAPFITV
jgi:hypothetical protein